MGRSSRRGVRLGALLVALVCPIAALGCGSESSGGESGDAVVKIGVISDLSGPTTSTQLPYNDGVKAGIAQYNADRASGQPEIEATYTDDKYDAAQALAAYRTAVSGGDVLTIGSNASAAQPAMVKQGLKIPVISGITTTITDDPRLWNLLPKFTDQAAVMVNYAEGKIDGPLRVAALVYDVPSGLEFADALEQETKALGGTYLGDVKIDPTQAAGDWRSQAQKLAELEPNFVGFLGSGGDPQTFLPAMANAGLTDVTVGGVTPALLYKENWTETPKSLASRFFGVSSISPAGLGTPGAAEAEAAADAAGEPEYADNIYFIQGLVAAKVATQAIVDAGADPTPDAVNDALGKLVNFDTGGLNPPLCFGPDDHYGTGQSRPLWFDLAKQEFVTGGDFADYAQYVKSTDGGC